MRFLKGIAETDNMPNATSTFRDIVMEVIGRANQSPSTLTYLRSTAEDCLQDMATVLSFCHTQGLFNELDQIIDKLTTQAVPQTYSSLEQNILPFLRLLALKLQNSRGALSHHPFRILYRSMLSRFVFKGHTPLPEPPPNWARRWRGCGYEDAIV